MNPLNIFKKDPKKLEEKLDVLMALEALEHRMSDLEKSVKDLADNVENRNREQFNFGERSFERTTDSLASLEDKFNKEISNIKLNFNNLAQAATKLSQYKFQEASHQVIPYKVHSHEFNYPCTPGCHGYTEPPYVHQPTMISSVSVNYFKTAIGTGW